MTSSEMISLRAGDLALDLAPTIGGSIARFAYRGMPLMRPPSAADIASRSPRALASYPLVPFSNRIVGGCFRFDGRDYRLALNFGDACHPRQWLAARMAGRGGGNGVCAYRSRSRPGA